MSLTETRTDDVSYLNVIVEHFVAPVFFFLSIVMFAESIYCLIHAGHQPKDLVPGCIAFALGYNAFRIGKNLAGEFEIFYFVSILRSIIPR